MHILKVPDKRLHKHSRKVKNFNEAKLIAKKLISAAKHIDRIWKPWIGMAAPQIGHNQRIFLLKRAYNKYVIIINPEIIEKKYVLPSIEKCYSLKNKVYILHRYFMIKLRYQDLKGKFFQLRIIGPKAWIIQQEIDHLNGILIADKKK